MKPLLPVQGLAGLAPQTHHIAGEAANDADTKRWTAVAGALALSPAQRQSLLDFCCRRSTRLAELEVLRRDLCMQV